MAMHAPLWTLSGLATELGMDRRALADKLQGLAPDKQEGSALLGEREERWWYMRRVVQHLTGTISAAKVNVDLNEQRGRLAREQADKYALENAQTRGQTMVTDDVLQVWSDALLVCKTRLMGIPDALNQKLDRADGKRIIPLVRAAIEEALTQLSEYREEDDTDSV